MVKKNFLFYRFAYFMPNLKTNYFVEAMMPLK